MISMQKLRGAVGELGLRGRSRLLASLALIICLLAMPQGAWPVDRTWIGATADYNTAGNWDPPLVPAATDTAFFTNTGFKTVAYGTAVVGPYNFSFSNDTANPYLITVADGISLNLGNLTTTSTGAVTISALPAGTGTLALAAGAHTFTLGLGQTTTVSLITSGEGGITTAKPASTGGGR